MEWLVLIGILLAILVLATVVRTVLRIRKLSDSGKWAYKELHGKDPPPRDG